MSQGATSTNGWELPVYTSVIPKLKQDVKDDEDVRMVAAEFPQCAAFMRQRVQCERARRHQVEYCDQLFGPKLVWCIVSSLCPTEAQSLVRCQSHTPDTAETDFTPVACKHREWLLNRCLDRQQATSSVTLSNNK